MKLDQETIKWVESALGDMQYGEVRLVICEGVVGKIITEEHRFHGKGVDKKVHKHVD